jgi:hypothetical protein
MSLTVFFIGLFLGIGGVNINADFFKFQSILIGFGIWMALVAICSHIFCDKAEDWAERHLYSKAPWSSTWKKQKEEK